MTVYVGSQDPEVTATFGVAFQDRFDRTNGVQYVKGDTTGVDTNWFPVAYPEPSGSEPDTYNVSADGTGQFTTISGAIAQAVSDGVSSANPKQIKVFPGTYPEPLTCVAGLTITTPLPGVVISGAVALNALNGTVNFAGLIVFTALVTLRGDLAGVFGATFTKCFISAGFTHLGTNAGNIAGATFTDCTFSAVAPIQFQSATVGNAGQIKVSGGNVAGVFSVDGDYRCLVENVIQSGSAFVGSGFEFRNNNSGTSIFADPPIRIFNSRLNHLTVQNFSGPPALVENCLIAATSALPPWLGEAILCDGATLIVANSVVGEPAVAAVNNLVRVVGGQFIALKSRLITNMSCLDLDAASFAQVYSAELSASGAQRAIEGAAGSTVIFANALFLDDNRVNPFVAILNQGTMALEFAGTDAAAPVAPGYQII